MKVNDRIALGRQRAGAAITLLRQGERETIFDALRFADDPEAMTQFIHRCRDRGVTSAELLECFELVDQKRGPLDGDRLKNDDTVMYALLLALGEFTLKEIPESRELLIQRLTAIYEKDPSSGVHSVTGWLLKTWGHDKEVTRVDETAIPYDESGHREWFVQEIEYSVGLLRGKNKFYLTFIVFPEREFTMGSPGDEPYHGPNEVLHQVTLTRPIAVCDRELTWGQWDAFDGAQLRELYSSQFSFPVSDSHPMMLVDWFEAVAYCRWLTQRVGLSSEDQCYDDPASLPKDNGGNPANWPLHLDRGGFRLLTEAEWEYVCRSGTRGAYSFGNDFELLGRYDWYLENSNNWMHPGGELRPNPRGLFDSHGNLMEWCHDWCGELASDTDPLGAEIASLRVYRGGCWFFPAWFCRSSYCSGEVPTGRGRHLGFRVASFPPASQPEASK